MEYIPVINKEGFIAASLYDVIHIPSSPYTVIPYSYYVMGLGKPLYIGYFIEKHGLWNEVFLKLINRLHRSRRELEYVMEMLKSIKLPMWEELRSMLMDLDRTVSRLFNEKRDELVDKIKTIFGFNKLFRKVYVIYGFNPLPKYTYGSMLYWDREGVIVATYVNDMHKPEKTIDIMVHEILHGLMRLNNINLKADIEELIIDISCPDGYLSRLLGLVSKVDINEIAEKYEDLAELATMVITYYENKIYRENIDLIHWITNYISDRRLPII